VIQVLGVLRSSILLELRQLATSRFMLMCVIFQPFFVAITTMFMLRHRPDFDPVYVVVGAALSGDLVDRPVRGELDHRWRTWRRYARATLSARRRRSCS